MDKLYVVPLPRYQKVNTNDTVRSHTERKSGPSEVEMVLLELNFSVLTRLRRRGREQAPSSGSDNIWVSRTTTVYSTGDLCCCAEYR